MRGLRPPRLPAVMETASERGTEAAGRALARLLKPGDVVALVGPLGAGKTCFVRGLARGLGVSDPVASPTFALVREYRGRLGVRHVDLYRLEPREIEELDWRDLFYGSGVYGSGLVVVEWADKAVRFLPPGYFLVEISPDPGGDPGRRVIRVSAPGGSPAAVAGTGAAVAGTGAAAPGAPGTPAAVAGPPASAAQPPGGAPGPLAGADIRKTLLPRAVTVGGPGGTAAVARALAIDTSTVARSLAVLNGRRVTEAYWPPERAELQAEDLAAAVAGLLTVAGMRPADLELVAVTLGPGSFTGVKVGLASAKALAYALGCPLKGVGTLDVLAAGALNAQGAGAQAEGRAGRARAARRTPAGPVAVAALLDAKRGEVFGAAYLDSADPLPVGEDGPYLVGPQTEVVNRLAEAIGRAAAGLRDNPAGRACPEEWRVGTVVVTGDWAPRLPDDALDAAAELISAAAAGMRWRTVRLSSARYYPSATDVLVLAARRLAGGAGPGGAGGAGPSGAGGAGGAGPSGPGPGGFGPTGGGGAPAAGGRRRVPAGDDVFALQPLYLRGPGVAEPGRTPTPEGGGRT